MIPQGSYLIEKQCTVSTESSKCQQADILLFNNVGLSISKPVDLSVICQTLVDNRSLSIASATFILPLCEGMIIKNVIRHNNFCLKASNVFMFSLVSSKPD